MYIVVDENNIRKESQFMAVAKQRQVESLLDIHNLILNKKPRLFVDLMDTTWKLNQAPEKVECEKRKE